MAEEKKEQQNPPMFDIIRLYSKDVSFETPNLPEVFKEEWKPETSIDLHVNINDKIDEANNVILIKGNVPGAKNSYVVVKNAVKAKNPAINPAALA